MTRNLCLLWLFAALLVACSGAPRRAVDGSARVQVTPDIAVEPLAPGVWRHISWLDVPPWGRVPANGLVVLGRDGALLVDTPWNDEQTETLLAWVERELGRIVGHAVVTHSHDDNMGGAGAIVAKGAQLWALPLTSELAVAKGWPAATHALPRDGVVSIDGVRIESYFPGHGHAPDNVALRFPDLGNAGILFAGCFLKSAAATSPGNLADADPAEWIAGLERLASRFPETPLVVPGHGAPGGWELLAHTKRVIAPVVSPR